MARAGHLSPRDVRRARDLAEWVLTESPKDGIDLDYARGEARHLLLALAPRRKPRRRKRASDIRKAVFVRAAGRCECCRSAVPTEWHHLIGGGTGRTT